MVRVSPRALLSCVLALAGVGTAIAFAAADDQGADASVQAQTKTARVRVEAVTPKAAAPRRLLSGFNPLVHTLEAKGYVASLDAGARAELTLDPALQERAEKILNDYSVPYGALVAIEPATGRVLAYVSHSSANPDAGDLVRDPTPPAASVFKVVTASALVDAGVGADTRACYGGGLSRLSLADITDDARRDRVCATLAEAVGGSINAVIGKLADKHLDAPTLRHYADAFGFGQKPVFDVAAPASPAEVPTDRLEFARTAAGFWHMHMSPLQGALLAATVANDGTMLRATMIDRIVDAHGGVLQTNKPQVARKVLSPATARSVGRMMLRTVSDGTAHSAFFERGKPFLPNIDVAGKTGTLNAESPFRGYSWWVGFAPAKNPTIALAALVVNTPKWRIKSSFLAREALREYLVEKPKRERSASAKVALASAAKP